MIRVSSPPVEEQGVLSEVAREHGPATGSEADETWRPTDTEVEAIPRDETGKGRRSP